MTELSDDQARAEDAVERFIASGSRQYFTLHGPAGTGKTWLMARVARRHRQAILAAPTGKSAAVLRRKVGLDVRTIHSTIFNFTGMVDDDDDPYRKVPTFKDKNVDLTDRLVIVDESSMIGRRLAESLLATGARVVATGDPGQLPPVRDAQFFSEADVALTTIHRQAWDSAVIRQAHAIRDSGSYAPDGDDFKVVNFAGSELLLEANMILCWRNFTRKKLNRKVRSLLGRTGRLKSGEPVMCLKNDYAHGVWNGEIYRLTEDRVGTAVVTVDDLGREIRVPRATVEGEREFVDLRYADGWVPFAPAYAATVHKAQGAESEGTVVVFDEFPRGQGWSSFMYTGVTRAKERAVVVNWK